MARKAVVSQIWPNECLSFASMYIVTRLVERKALDLACVMMQEINLMEKLSFDRNIVQFYGAVLSAPAPMLVLEYMEGEPCFAVLLAYMCSSCRSIRPT